MKKVLFCFVVLILFVCVFSLNGCNQKTVEKDGLIFEKRKCVNTTKGTETEGYVVAGCYENMEIVNIPAYINDKPVYSIEYDAFENGKSIKEIVIPETIEFFNHAFAKCVNVEKIATPVSDMYKLFANATPQKLKYVYLTDKCTKIETNDFQNISSLLEVHIPKSVVKIEDGTNLVHIGVNGHTPPGKFDCLPFLNCNPELKIYCEAKSKPNGWGIYWNFVNDWQQATVFWGGNDTKTDVEQDKTPVLKHIASVNNSTISNYFSWGSHVSLTSRGVLMQLDNNKTSCGINWDLSGFKLKSNTKYIIKLEGVSIAGKTDDDIKLRVQWIDSAYKSMMYYHVKGHRFDTISSNTVPDSYYQILTKRTYNTYDIEFEFLHSSVANSKDNMLYFVFFNVKNQLSIKSIGLYEVTYE